jgi:hypothetical protein
MSATHQIRELLSQDWKPAVQVEEEAAAQGITARQVRTARQRLGVTRATGSVMRKDGQWWIRLPDGRCPTCGGPMRGPWGDPWGSHDATRDYWSGHRVDSATSGYDESVSPLEHESPSVTYTPALQPPVPNYGPPRCNICGKATAVDPGSPCPYSRPDGQRCPGVVG